MSIRAAVFCHLRRLEGVKNRGFLGSFVKIPYARIGGRGGGRGVRKPSKPKVLTFTKTHLKFLGGWYINKIVTVSDILV